MLSTELHSASFPVRQTDIGAHLRRLLSPGPEFALIADSDAQREEVETYISARFKEAYGAQLADFLPLLLTMQCRGKLSAAAGMSFGSPAPFFLEQYLDVPIESIVLGPDNVSVSRARIVEIGNLVANGNGASLSLFIVLTSLLTAAGMEYMVFTATRGLRQKFSRFGLATTVLAPASESALDNNHATSWGSYYAEQPEVMVARIADAKELIESHKLFSLIALAFKSQTQELTGKLPGLGGDK